LDAYVTRPIVWDIRAFFKELAGGLSNTGQNIMDDRNKNTAARRLARYGRVSGTMAGLAARLAGERFLGIRIEREEQALQWMQALGNLKGPLMKVGQILATIPEALPPEYAKAFQQLQANAPPMGWPFVRRRMKAELGQNWPEKFRS